MRGPIFFSLLALVLFVGAFLPRPEGTNPEKEAVLMQTMLEGLRQLHYAPLELDDAFSQKLYKLYLDRIDSGRRWLTQEDIVKLEVYKNDLDDEARASSYEFFNQSLEALNAGIEKTKGFYKDILAQPFDFSVQEEFEVDGDKKEFPKNDLELRESWRQLLKYEAMLRLTDKLEAQEKDESKEEKKSMTELEAEVREDLTETYDDLFERLGKLRRMDRISDYLNAFTNVYDPHTGYFEPKDKEDFDINMSGTLEGIGARLQTDGDFTKVVSIVPGGPAWKQKDLETSDLIMKVAQENDEEPVNVSGYRIDDVVKLIRGKKGTTVRLTVKKVDGSIQVISIERDVVIIDESYAKSVILNQPGKIENVGYIKLPRFYADFNRRGGRACAADVAKELDKLKAQNVNGIILDLRNNGGGSLSEVVSMSGLFIEDGPIVQVKARGMMPKVQRDNKSTVQYDGPLIIMVNQFSASASEILAAAMQDYGRALIVGSKSTFGKGTVQRFVDLDMAISGYNEIKPLGELKMTIQKFYRIDGGSTQLRGVTPDVILPDRYHFIEVGEKDHEYPMDWSEISAVNYDKQNRLGDLTDIKRASGERVKQSEAFRMVLESAKYLAEQRDDTQYTLNLEQFRKESEEMEARADKYDNIFTEIDNLEVNNLAVDMDHINSDESRVARNDEWLKSLRKDVYVDEVLSIMKDMTQQ